MAVSDELRTRVQPFVAKYGTRLKFDMRMFEELTDVELIYAMSAKINEAVCFDNETREMMEAVQEEWRTYEANLTEKVDAAIDKIPSQVTDEVNRYTSSDEFQEQLDATVEPVVKKHTQGMQAQIDANKSAISGLQTAVAGKADKSALTALEQAVAQNRADFEAAPIGLSPLYVGFSTPNSVSDTQNDAKLCVSTDGVNYRVTEIESYMNTLSSTTADPYCFVLADGRFVVMMTSVAEDHKWKHMVTSDFETWLWFNDAPPQVSQASCWSPSLFYDASGNLWCTYSGTVQSGNFADLYGGTHPHMHVFACQCAFGEDGRMTLIGTPVDLGFSDGSHTVYIDADILYRSGTYYATVKNQYTTDCEMFTATSPAGPYTRVCNQLYGRPSCEGSRMIDAGNAMICIGTVYESGIELQKTIYSVYSPANKAVYAGGWVNGNGGSFNKLTSLKPVLLENATMLKYIYGHMGSTINAPSAIPTETLNVNAAIGSKLNAMKTAGLAFWPLDGQQMMVSDSYTTALTLPRIGGNLGCRSFAVDVPGQCTVTVRRRGADLSPALNGTTRTVLYVPFTTREMTATLPPTTVK